MDPTNLKLRSRDWCAKDGWWGLAHGAWLRAGGLSERVFEGKPVIGICSSWHAPVQTGELRFAVFVLTLLARVVTHLSFRTGK